MNRMTHKEKLLERLEQIGKSLQQTAKARALIGFGSVAENERMDAYSDLDFLVVAKKKCKRDLIENLAWITSIFSVGYYYQHTGDGYRLFYEDGVFCDFGIVEEEEIAHIPHAEGRVIWCEEDFDTQLRLSNVIENDSTLEVNKEIGDILTCLFVGLSRYARGEKLSAFQHIQVDAMNRVISLASIIYGKNDKFKDPFQHERRLEGRYPKLAEELPNLIQGYKECPQSATSMLSYLDKHFELNEFMKNQIKVLANQLM